MRERPYEGAVSVGNRAPAVLRRSEPTRFSSASDDEVGGISRAMRERPYEAAVSEADSARDARPAGQK
jgi:hypothetical protein